MIQNKLTDLISVGDVSFTSNRSIDEAIKRVVDTARESDQGLAVRFSNAYCVAMASSDPSYRAILNGPGITFPDGSPVAFVMRLKRPELRSARVRGPSFFERALQVTGSRNLSHAFVGSSTDAMTKLSIRIATEHPDLKVTDTYSPPFGYSDEELVDDIIERMTGKPDFLWLGLGSPKQDRIAAHLAKRTGVVVLGVGAAFDFYAGTVKEAPKIIQRLGVEWFYRLLSEPKRLWRRYFFGNAIFIGAVLRRALRI